MSTHVQPTTETRSDVDQSAELVYCPECGLPAWLEWTDHVASTAGPIELAKVRCFGRHWFLMPRADLNSDGRRASRR